MKMFWQSNGTAISNHIEQLYYHLLYKLVEYGNGIIGPGFQPNILANGNIQ